MIALYCLAVMLTRFIAAQEQEWRPGSRVYGGMAEWRNGGMVEQNMTVCRIPRACRGDRSPAGDKGRGEIDFSSRGNRGLVHSVVVLTLKSLNIRLNQGNLCRHGCFVSTDIECDNETALELSELQHRKLYCLVTINRSRGIPYHNRELRSLTGCSGVAGPMAVIDKFCLFIMPGLNIKQAAGRIPA